tara:strand:+ start:1016 stop:1150 length:135 start_codon:yes stop_codon:yes gene_type:complete
MKYPENQLEEEISWRCEICCETYYFDNESDEDICYRCKMSDFQD